MRIRKALVIKTEQEENGCVQIRHTYTIDDRLVTELVSLAISQAFLKASPSKDEAEPVTVMISPIASWVRLARGKPPKFSRPKDDGTVQQTARFQISD